MKMVRTSVRLRQKDMAVVLGVSRQSLIQYECDICAPPYRVLRNACEEFGIDGSWLLLGGPSSTMLRYGKKGAV
jgi:transcriptional regulator with XRE-family HTH domain